MNQPDNEQNHTALLSAAQEWATCVKETPIDIRQEITDILGDHTSELRERYLSYLANDEAISAALTTEKVRRDFTETFMQLVTSMLGLEPEATDLFCERQSDIGHLLVRIGMPTHSLSRSMRKLKLWFLNYLAELEPDPKRLAAAIRYLITTIDISVELREVSYHADITSYTRIEEAYRLQALGQNLAMERERQRAMLMEWNNHLLSALYHQPSGTVLHLPRLSKSDFGLWLAHKATLLFEKSSQIDQVTASVTHIDTRIVPQIEQAGYSHRDAVAQLMSQIENELATIKYCVNTLFDSQMEIENGRDPLTQLLNRRFLPVVLMREINMQKKSSDQGFCVIIIDIDHFKDINDRLGHLAGDSALQQVATTITGCARPSDFVFRYGGEEIVILLVDCTIEMAENVAERIRKNIEGMTIRLLDDQHLTLTVSLGVAAYTGEVDYKKILSRADDALYQAKSRGRNQVVLAKGNAPIHENA